MLGVVQASHASLVLFMPRLCLAGSHIVYTQQTRREINLQLKHSRTHTIPSLKNSLFKVKFCACIHKTVLKTLKLTMFFKCTVVQICIHDIYRALLLTAVESTSFNLCGCKQMRFLPRKNIVVNKENRKR